MLYSNGKALGMNLRDAKKTLGAGMVQPGEPNGGGGPMFRLNEKHPLYEEVRKVLHASGIKFTGRTFGPCLCAGAKAVGQDAITAQTSAAFAESFLEACVSVGPCPRRSVNKAVAALIGGSKELAVVPGTGALAGLLEKFKGLSVTTRLGLGAAVIGGGIVGLMYFLDKRGEKSTGLSMSPDSQPWQLAGAKTIDVTSYKTITEDDPLFHYSGESSSDNQQEKTS